MLVLVCRAAVLRRYEHMGATAPIHTDEAALVDAHGLRVELAAALLV